MAYHDVFRSANFQNDNFRVHLFDIVTQYRALFSDDDPLMGSAPASNRILFSSWMERKISDFLFLLKTDLQRGAKKQSLDAIIGQVGFFVVLACHQGHRDNLEREWPVTN